MPRKPGRKRQIGGGPNSVAAKRVVAGMMDGKTMEKAAIAAGYSKGYAASQFYSTTTADWVRKEVQRRMDAAMSKAGVHTDVITGSLVEMMMASPADIMPEHEILRRARENGVDHLIKKITVTPIKLGTKERVRAGKVISELVIGEKIDLEMYSRLDAISQLRDNFGMKQEPRANTFEETRRQEVEREIDKIAEAEGCDRPTAAQMLKDALGDDSPLIPTVNKYVH